MTPEEVLGRAKDLLSQGWTRNTFHAVLDGRHCFCALGAVMEAVQPGTYTAHYVPEWDEAQERVYWEAVERLDQALHCRQVYRSVAHFNDFIAEDVRDVLALFEEARSL